MGLFEQVQETVRTIRARAGSLSPKVGIILGSGLGDFADGFEDRLGPRFPDMTTAYPEALRVRLLESGRRTDVPLLAAGIGGKPLTHEEVAETAHRVKGLFTRLLEDFLPTVARAGASKA